MRYDTLVSHLALVSRTAETRAVIPGDFSQPRIALVVAALFILVGCETPLFAEGVPDDAVRPTVIAIVADSEQRGADRLVTLTDGRHVTLDADAIALSGGAADGNLLIVGEGGPKGAEGQTWYVGVFPAGPDCFDLSANGVVRGERLATSYGFSLPLSAQWDETETRFIKVPAVGFCLNERGEVVSAYPGSTSR